MKKFKLKNNGGSFDIIHEFTLGGCDYVLINCNNTPALRSVEFGTVLNTATPATAKHGKRYSAIGHPDFLFHNQWSQVHSEECSPLTRMTTLEGERILGIGYEEARGMFLITSPSYVMTEI